MQASSDGFAAIHFFRDVGSVATDQAILTSMDRALAVAALLPCLLVAHALAAEAPADPVLEKPDGSTVTWSDWCASNGPSAVLLWASWSPEAQLALAAAPSIQEAAAKHELKFVVVALQEPAEEARPILTQEGLPWMSDRHGALLKKLLVFEVPRLIVVSRDGKVLAAGPAEVPTVQSWDTQ